MHRVLAAAVLVAVGVVPASAQSSRIYAAAVGGVDNRGPGTVQVGAVSTVGGLLGLRLSEAWSLEIQADGGFGQSSDRVFEGLLVSSPPGPGPHTREDFERYGVFGRVVSRDSAGPGYSAQVVWRTSLPGRVNAALLAGFAGRNFTRQHALSITSIGDDLISSPLTSRVENQRTTGRELMGGLMVPIRVANRITVAPEFRYKYNAGLLSDESGYSVLHFGARVMWGF